MSDYQSLGYTQLGPRVKELIRRNIIYSFKIIQRLNLKGLPHQLPYTGKANVHDTVTSGLSTKDI